MPEDGSTNLALALQGGHVHAAPTLEEWLDGEPTDGTVTSSNDGDVLVPPENVDDLLKNLIVGGWQNVSATTVRPIYSRFEYFGWPYPAVARDACN
jgi:hypothetical protein